MTPRILIVKKGATGDVVRTTVLLHVLEGDITWVTHPYNGIVLPQRYPSLHRILTLEEARDLHERFDLVVSLDDDAECAQLASSVESGDLMGTWFENGRVRYTDHFKTWFDMSLVSVYGREEADRRKLANRRTFQELLFEGFGRTFSDDDCYLVNESIGPANPEGPVGIEARAGERWPTKAWNGYGRTAEWLEAKGYPTVFLEQRATLMEYMKDIAACRLLLTGDTLAMHIALALKIPVVAVFTCTSPWEIHGYGRMEKVVSPLLDRAFYRTAWVPEAVEAVTVDDVCRAFSRLVPGP